MHNVHDPDPQFAQRLEWQIASELRRGRRRGATRQRSARVLKIVGLILGSVAVGAAGMEASQQLEDAWRRELLEARLQVQLDLARQRVEMHRETIGLTRAQVEAGLRDDRDLIHMELQVARAEADARIMALELEELERTGREPLGKLSSPLVDGRDYVSEKVAVRMEVARKNLEVIRLEEDRFRRLAEPSRISPQDLMARRLVALEAELQLQAMARQLELRRAYLDSEISAVEAELELLAVEAENHVHLLQEQLEVYRLDLDRFRETEGNAVALSQIEARVAEVEGQLSLARAEMEIVGRELTRRREEG